MIEKFVILLLVFLDSFVTVSMSVSMFNDSACTTATTDSDRHFSEVSILTDRMVNAAFRKDIVFICKSPTTTEIFTVKPKNIEGFRRLDTRFRLGFFVHGWEALSISNVWMLDLLKTWSYREYINICLVDWYKLARVDYVLAAWNVYDVGYTVASVIKSLEKRGLFHRSRITITGFSLGAHVAGFAGDRLGGKVDHIIGLDPAGPLFTIPVDVGKKYRLDKSDGRFVQVIHTTGGVLGVEEKCGHADFYPNGGVSPQPNCHGEFTFMLCLEDFVCSHLTVVKYFTYSMDKNLPYVGYKCRNYRDFIKGRCWSNAVGILGIHTNRLNGNFYLTTKPEPPYV